MIFRGFSCGEKTLAMNGADMPFLKEGEQTQQVCHIPFAVPGLLRMKPRLP